MTKRKVTLELIEDAVDRRACFKKRQKGLLQKLNELSILCGIDACAIIDGPCDAKPTVWPSLTVAKDLLHRFQEAPMLDQFKNKVNQHVYMQDKTKKIHDQLVRLKQRNDEKEFSIFMNHIYHDGKSLSDFKVSDLRRLLCYVEEKLKCARKKISHFEKVLPPNPNPNPNPTSPISCPIENEILDDIETWFNRDEQVSEVQPLLDLVEETDFENRSGIDNNNGSNMGLLPHGYDLGDIDMGIFSECNFEGLNGENDCSKLLGQDNFGDLNVENNDLGVLPQGNVRDLNGESDHSHMFPQFNLEGLNVENDLEMVPQDNCGGLNGENEKSTGV